MVRYCSCCPLTMPRMPSRCSSPVGQERVNENQQMRRRLESELRETCDLVTLKWYGMVTEHMYIYIYIQMIRDKEIKKIGNADVSLGSTFVIRFSWLNPLVRWLETQESPVVPSPQLILFALCMIARGTQIHMTKNTLQDTKTHIRSLEAPLAQPWQVRAPSGVLGVLGI